MQAECEYNQDGRKRGTKIQLIKPGTNPPILLQLIEEAFYQMPFLVLSPVTVPVSGIRRERAMHPLACQSLRHLSRSTPRSVSGNALMIRTVPVGCTVTPRTKPS